jgi:hypothetical protein
LYYYRRGRKGSKEVFVKILRVPCVLSDLCGEFVIEKYNICFWEGNSMPNGAGVYRNYPTKNMKRIPEKKREIWLYDLSHFSGSHN